MDNSDFEDFDIVEDEMRGDGRRQDFYDSLQRRLLALEKKLHEDIARGGNAGGRARAERAEKYRKARDAIFKGHDREIRLANRRAMIMEELNDRAQEAADAREMNSIFGSEDTQDSMDTGELEAYEYELLAEEEADNENQSVDRNRRRVVELGKDTASEDEQSEGEEIQVDDGVIPSTLPVEGEDFYEETISDSGSNNNEERDVNYNEVYRLNDRRFYAFTNVLQNFRPVDQELEDAGDVVEAARVTDYCPVTTGGNNDIVFDCIPIDILDLEMFEVIFRNLIRRRIM